MAETVLKDIGLYKNRLLVPILNNEDICKCLLNKESFTEEEVDDLVYSQVFPYLYVDETQTEVKSYIGIEIDVPRIPTATIKDMKIIVWVYAHKECMRYAKKDYSGTRVDILCDMIERTIGDSDNFGIGKLYLESATYMGNINKKYYGRQLIFSSPDFKVKR